MSKIPQAIINFIPGKMAWVATADASGLPNVAPKGSVQVLDNQTLLFADIFSNKTRTALEQNPKAALAVIDPARPEGYQFKGDAVLLNSGPIFEKVKEELKKRAPKLPEPKYVVKINVTEVYSLTPGPEAGKKIA